MDVNALLETKEYYIANEEELSIEESICNLRINGRKPESESPETMAMRAALREIDNLKAQGNYEAERARLREQLKIDNFYRNSKTINTEPYAKFLKDWENLREGMYSPDPDQKKRFRRFYDAAELGPKLPRDIADLIAVLEPVKKRRGRKVENKPKWRKDAWALDAMRLLVAKGSSTPEAARTLAQQEGLAQQDSRAKRFENLYRARMSLR